MQLTIALREHTRSQSATAALARLEQPPVNLLGLDNSHDQACRRRCHEAALLRFVMNIEPVPEVKYNVTQTRKRPSSDEADIVHT